MPTERRRYRYKLRFMCLVLMMVCQVQAESVFGKMLKVCNELFVDDKEAPSTVAHDTRVIYRFFDDAFTPGGFVYAYPEASKVTVCETDPKNGEVSLQFDLVPSTYSGGSVCLYNGVYNLYNLRKNGSRLQFWIKGAKGKEQVMAALVDEAVSDDKKTVVRLRVDWFGCDSITTGWTPVSIPLKKFKDYGLYWDEKDSVEIEEKFDWDKVAEFRLEVRKDENESFRVWADDIFIVE